MLFANSIIFIFSIVSVKMMLKMRLRRLVPRRKCYVMDCFISGIWASFLGQFFFSKSLPFSKFGLKYCKQGLLNPKQTASHSNFGEFSNYLNTRLCSPVAVSNTLHGFYSSLSLSCSFDMSHITKKVSYNKYN